MITVARLVPASRIRTVKITNAAAVHTSPSTITHAIAPAVGVVRGGSSAANGARITDAIASPTPSGARGSSPARPCLITIGPIA